MIAPVMSTAKCPVPESTALRFDGRWKVRSGEKALVESFLDGSWHRRVGDIDAEWDLNGLSRTKADWDLMERFNGTIR